MPDNTLALRNQPDTQLLGIGTMLLSVLLFSIMDATDKWLGSSYPTQQIMFFRCAVAIIPVSIIIYTRGGISILKTQQPALHLLRSILGISAMGLAFYAFSLMRLADAISILHASPIIMTALSVFLLRESVGIHRWSTVLAGFIGMLIVVRPGEGMLASGSIFMLIAAVLIGFTTIIIRHLTARDDPVCITFYFTVTGVIVSAIGISLLGWNTPTPRDWIFLSAVGLFGGIAQYLMTVSYRHAKIAIVAPLKYSSIAIGGFFGYLIWGEIPDLQSFTGIAIIVASGLYTLHREILHAGRSTL